MNVTTAAPIVTRCPACDGGLVALYGTGRGEVIAYGEWEEMPTRIVLRAVCQYRACRHEFDVTFDMVSVTEREEDE